MKKIKKWIHLFGMLCFVIAPSRGDEVLITTPHVTSSSEGKCNFPEVLSVELTLPGSDEGWRIPLTKDSIFKTERTVLFMSETQQNVVEEFTLTSEEHSGVEAYHNHEHGAAFIAKCVRRDTETQYLLLEGSVFINSNKFRITPSPSWSMNLQVFPSHVTANYNMTYIEEFLANDAEAILDSSSSYLEMMVTLPQTGERHKRAVTLPVTYYLDILVVVDSFFYDSFYKRNGGNANQTANKVHDYLAILFSHVAMRQDTLQLENRTLKIRLTNPVMLKKPSENPFNSSVLKSANNRTTIDAKTLLELFSKWLVNTSKLGAYDHAMLISGLDIEGGSDSGIKFNITQGLAFVGTFCQQNGSSSSIISDKGAYQSEGVAAHELTHSLGSRHDGENNNCSSADRYIMSAGSFPETNRTRLNPWKYSACSSQYVLNLLKELEKNATILQTCLKDSHGNDTSVNTTISADEQCRLTYGNGTSVCRGGTVPPLDNICDEFYCRVPDTLTCNRFIAATGTCCAAQKKCIQGQCVDAKQGECPWGECPYEDQQGIVESSANLTCAQLTSTHCYIYGVYLKCCHACAKMRTLIPDCLYGDREPGCNVKDCGGIFSEGPNVNQTYKSVCCKTCTNPCTDKQTLPIPGQDPVSCNKLIVDNQYHCYNSSVLDNCCLTCNKTRDVTNKACPWKEMSDCSTRLNSKPRPYNCTADERIKCCRMCSTLSVITTTTSKISTITTPATTSTSTKRAITSANSTTQAAPSTGVTQRKIAPCWNVIMCGATTNTISPSVLGFLGAVYICLVKWLFG